MDRLWTRPFVQLTVSLLFLFTGFYMLLPTLPLYIMRMGGSDTDVGLVVGVFTLAAVLFRPIVGGLLDKYGRRAFVLGGMAFFALSLYLYEATGGIVTLLLLRIAHGTSWAFATTAAGAAVTDIIPLSRRGEGMGWYGMAMTAAMAVGPMVGTSVLDSYGSGGLFLVGAGLAVVALVLAVITPMPFVPKDTGGRIEMYDKSLLPIMISIAFLTVAYGGVATFVPLFAESLDANPGLFFLVYAAALTLIRPVAGRLADRRGEGTVIIPAVVVVALSLATLSLSSGLVGILAAAVLYGIGFGAAQPALQAATLRLARRDQIGIANASFFTAFDLGIGLGSITLGWIGEFTGYRILFIVCAASVAVALIIFLLSVRGPLARRFALLEPSAEKEA